ncbi:hypothetical protein [Paenibacillus sp. IITD108]|uniref:hypothetical protein n=1 Tax=Paenibacillus sp. IITD108 TaxID=3116649 RepID=UPI002F3EC067
MEHRIRSFSTFSAQLEERKQKDIQRWKAELNLCQAELVKLRKQVAKEMTRVEQVHLQNRLRVEEKRKSILLGRLKTAGVQIEKRGRPKKDPSEAYKQTHVKFTAMLKPENLEYLKCLKESGGIDNISALLDSLIERHRDGLG